MWYFFHSRSESLHFFLSFAIPEAHSALISAHNLTIVTPLAKLFPGVCYNQLCWSMYQGIMQMCSMGKNIPKESLPIRHIRQWEKVSLAFATLQMFYIWSKSFNTPKERGSPGKHNMVSLCVLSFKAASGPEEIMKQLDLTQPKTRIQIVEQNTVCIHISVSRKYSF